ncbi:MAG: HNH endonuclease [Actinobacteria bacterium]|nr:HNH endonuclease [Actinomycetota bacterium]
MKELPSEFMALLGSITNKRARVVIDHILKHGFITTEDLEKTYGYNHPPRAARDVREAGIPLDTFHVKSSEGRSIAAYGFGDLSKIQNGRLAGRAIISKEFKQALYAANESKCYVCSGHFKSRYLQVDHRVPYEVAGEKSVFDRELADYMLLCGSCNRAKSWSCEHCPNWMGEKLSEICLKCYWGKPEDYQHIALRSIRRADIIWEEDEVDDYERLKYQSQNTGAPLPEYVKEIVAKYIDQIQHD